jgi:lysophospholipase L1-like esterase
MSQIIRAATEVNAPRHIYNPGALQYWHALKSRARGGGGGVDVMVIGDSFVEGTYITNYITYAWPQILRRLLQAKYNPSGVVGGLGFFQIRPAGYGYPTNPAISIGTGAGQWSAAGPSGGILAKATRHPGTDANEATIELTMDQVATSAEMLSESALPDSLPYCTDLECLVAASGTTYGTVALAMDAAVGSYSALATVTLETPSGKPFGLKLGRVASPDGESWTHATLPTTGTYKYKITAQASKYCDFQGYIHYADDWNCGVRLHAMAMAAQLARVWVDSGTSLLASPPVSGTGTNSELDPILDFDNVAYSAYAGAARSANKKIGLIVIGNGGLIEYGIGNGVTNPQYGYPATYQAALQAIITRINTLHTAPKVSILLVPQWQRGDMVDSTQTYKYAAYNAACYAVAAANSDNVAVVDMFKATRETVRVATTNLFIYNAGLEHTDHIHPNVAGAQFIAERVFEALVG